MAIINNNLSKKNCPFLPKCVLYTFLTNYVVGLSLRIVSIGLIYNLGIYTSYIYFLSKYISWKALYAFSLSLNHMFVYIVLFIHVDSLVFLQGCRNRSSGLHRFWSRKGRVGLLRTQ